MKILAFIFLIFLSSCSGDKTRYSATEMWFLIQDFDPAVELVPIPQSQVHRRILCSSYGRGCISGSGKRLLVRKVEMIAIEFKDESLAKAEALRLNGYYFKNWFFDDVTGEPVLESFLKAAFGAKNPREESINK